MKDDRIRKSQAQEKRTAKLHRGRVRPGSGNQAGKKGDVKAKHTLIENKRTDAKQIVLKDEVLRKIFAEAWAEGRIPVIGFELCGRHYVVVAEADWLDAAGDDDFERVVR